MSEQSLWRRAIAATWRTVLLGFAVLGLIAAFIALPSGPAAEAGRNSGGKGLFTIDRSHQDELPNYDIRTDKGAFEKLAVYRNSLSRSASDVADQRDDLVRGESTLKAKISTLKIEYSPEIRTPKPCQPISKVTTGFLRSGRL